MKTGLFTKTKRLKKSIIIIQSKNGQHKSSIIRTISQILIGLSDDTIVNVEELGLSDNIASIVQLDSLKIGVATENDVSDNTLVMIRHLADKFCDAILCATHSDSNHIQLIDKYAKENQFSMTVIKSHWSDKLEVNYLTEDQVDKILNEIKQTKVAV